jgi:ATP-dependent helicase HrpB
MVGPRGALPIDAIAGDVADAVTRGRNVVVLAEPGAGKTTRLPLVMTDARWPRTGELWVTQPRRIAARLAAAHVAASRGEAVGDSVGYQVRFDRKVSAATKIRFVTEGILVRKLIDDPGLDGIGAVVFDEFHERHLDADTALALCRALQQGRRPDLGIVVMSATLDPEPIAAYLDAVPLRCAGRSFPVEIDYLVRTSERPLGTTVATALADLGPAGTGGGGVLVFLPGAREIRDAAGACSGIARRLGLEMVTLHGDLPPAEQDQAVRRGDRPKLVLATNVAETSITIDGITVVLDSGLVRQASFDPWSGIGSLVLGKTSKAAAIQRAGRAGRTQPGRCLRLYPRHDFDKRAAFDPPEIHRLDLAAVALTVRAAGVHRIDAMPWFEPPPVAAMRAADELLRRLDAIDANGALTDRGRRMLRHPLHPRLARLVDAGHELGIATAAAGAAALLSERSIRRNDGRPATTSASSDVLVDLDDLGAFAGDRSRGHDGALDPQAARTVLELWRTLAQGKVPGARATEEDTLGRALLAAFPDRVAAVRRGPIGTRSKLAFVGGAQAELAESSAVTDAAFVVAVRADTRKEGTTTTTLVRQAAAIEPEWLLELDMDRLEERRACTFDADRGRVETMVETRWDGLLLESRRDPRPSPEASAVLLAAARSRGPTLWCDDPDALVQLAVRGELVAKHDPNLRVPTTASIDAVLAAACEGRTSFAQLREANVVELVLAELGPDRNRFERAAPTHVALPGGHRVAVHYEPDRSPWIESRMQDFFGSAEGPRLFDGRIPLAIHLLAPNGRAEQITVDLAGFWKNHYPEIRRALMRRYPRHDWPEDPRNATPPAPRPRR